MKSAASEQEWLPRNPAFINVVAVDGPGTTIDIGGQNTVTAADEIVGKDDIAAQTEQVFRKLDLAPTAAGATLENVVSGGDRYSARRRMMRDGGPPEGGAGEY